MSVLEPENSSRRTTLRRMMGAGAVTAGLPLLSNLLRSEGLSVIAPAMAAGNSGAQANQGDLVYISGASAPTSTIAEWVDPKGPTGPFRIAASKAALERAPATAAHYEAKLYNFPSGSLRVLTFKKGQPVSHMITLETEIYVISGSATLTPLPGLPGKPVKISAGDALFLPSGNITNPRAAEDFVLLQFMVQHTVHGAKSAIITAKQASVSNSANWQVDGQEFSASKPEEMKKVPKNAVHVSVKRYAFEGNSIRVATQKGSGRSNTFNNSRGDVILYIAKGRIRRKEGDQMLELVAGDAVREKKGNSGYWEILEEAVFISTDAPVNPAMLPPASI